MSTALSDTSNRDILVLQAARTLASAVAVLPFLLLLPVDYDKLAPLALMPAILVGWRVRPCGVVCATIETGLLAVAATSALLSAALGAHPAASFVSLSSWIWIFAAAVLARRCALSPRALRTILLGITVGSSLGCLAVWAAWPHRSSAGIFPFYGHWRVFGLHMMAGTMSGLALLISSHGPRVKKFFLAFLAAISCGGLLWSGGRAPLVGLGCGVLLWLWRSPGDRRSLVLQGGAVALGGLVLSLLHWTPESYLGWWTAAARTANAASVNELTSTRLSFWHTTWAAFTENPWLGRGADAYRYLTPKLDGDQPHNWLLQYLLDFGIFGALVMVALFLRQAIVGFTFRDSNGEAQSTRYGIAAAWVACLVTGLLDGVFYHAVILVPAAVLAGMSGSPFFLLRQGYGGQAALSRFGKLKALSLSKGSQLSALRSQLSPLISPLYTRRSTLTSHLFALRSSLFALISQLRPIILLLSVIVLALHSYLVWHLRYANPPEAPTAMPARVIREFPSTTTGIERWLAYWRTKDETTTLEWTLWAAQHAAGPAPLHLYAAVLYADRDDFVSADREMQSALDTAHWSSRPSLEHMRASIREAARSAMPAVGK